MPGDITLKIDADTAAYIAKISRLADAHEKVNERVAKHGTLQDKVTHGLERTVFKAIALVEVLGAVSRAFTEAAKKSAELSKSAGESTIKTSSALANLGIKGKDLQAAKSVVEADTGVATLSESEAFVSSLSQAGVNLTKKQIYQAVSAYKRGGELAFGPGGESLIKGIKEGRAGDDISAYANQLAADRLGVTPGGDAIERGLAAAGEEVNQELDIRRLERAKELRKRQAESGPARLAQEQLELEKLSSPIKGAAMEVLSAATRGGSDVYAQKLLESNEAARLEERRKIIRTDAHEEGSR